MLLYTAILTALAPPFLLIILGAGLKRLRVLHPAHVPILNGLVLNVTLPALILLGLLRAPALSPRLALPVLAMFLAEMIALGAVYGLGRGLRLPRRLLGAVLIVGIFGNTSFIGYPLTLAIFPRQFPATILLDQFGMTLPMYLTAAIVGSRFGGGDGSGGHKAAMGRFFRSPIFLSAVLGLGLHLLPPLPSMPPLMHRVGTILAECLSYLGQGNDPAGAACAWRRPAARRGFKTASRARPGLRIEAFALPAAGLGAVPGIRGRRGSAGGHDLRDRHADCRAGVRAVRPERHGRRLRRRRRLHGNGLVRPYRSHCC